MALRRQKLKEARLKKNLSQEKLAELLGMERTIVSYWENAVNAPSLYARQQLQAFFKIEDIDALLEVTEESGGAVASPPLAPIAVIGVSPTSTQRFIASNPVRLFWQIAHTDYTNPSELTTEIQSVIGNMTMTMDNLITRRDALCELASIPLISLGRNVELKPSKHEEMLRYCTAAFEGCWELYRGSDPDGTQHAFECVSTYLPLLEAIAHDSSKLRKQVLGLATRYALLQTLLGWNRIGARESVGYAQNALSLSCESGNILLRLSAHTKLSYTYLMSTNCAMALKTMQEGEYALKEYQRRKNGPALPVGVAGNFYSGYCVAQVDNGIEPDPSLGIATDSEPLKGHVALMEFNAFDQHWEAARACNSKGDPRQAMKWISKLVDPDTLTLRIPQNEGSRVTALSTLTHTLLLSQERDMGQIIRVWTANIEGAKALRAEERYRKAIANFEIMKALWPNEQAIKRLKPLTSHW